jgi:prepilin-type N-terminal cleavage/methylation domain-containing protein
MRRRDIAKRRSSGFTLIEALVVVAIVGLIGALVFETMTAYVPRFRLRHAASEMSMLISKARLEAIRRSVTTVVAVDYSDRTVSAFAELNGNPNDPERAGALYLVYDPDPLAEPDRTDYRISLMALPGPPEAGVQIGGPVDGIEGADALVGLTPTPGALANTPKVLVFHPNGAVDAPGAFRFTDNRQTNFLETTITTLTGKTEIRKYLLADDSPTSVAGFFPEGNVSFEPGSVGQIAWTWY